MVEDKILTKHPQGKKGVNINKAKYDAIKISILKCLEKRELTHEELTKCVGEELQGKFEGSTPWYVETLKLDLEASNIIEGA